MKFTKPHVCMLPKIKKIEEEEKKIEEEQKKVKAVERSDRCSTM